MNLLCSSTQLHQPSRPQPGLAQHREIVAQQEAVENTCFEDHRSPVAHLHVCRQVCRACSRLHHARQGFKAVPCFKQEPLTAPRYETCPFRQELRLVFV